MEALIILGCIGFGLGYILPMTWIGGLIVIFLFILLRMNDDFARVFLFGFGLYVFIGMGLGNGYAYWENSKGLKELKVQELQKQENNNSKHYKIIDGVVYIKAEDVSETIETKQEKSTWEKIKTWKPFEKEGE